MPWIKYQNKNRSIFHLEIKKVRYTLKRHKEEKYFIKLCLFGLKKVISITLHLHRYFGKKTITTYGLFELKQLIQISKSIVDCL